MHVQRCPECGQRLKSNYCDICMRRVPFGGVKIANRRDPWDSWDSSSAHRMEKGHECVSFGKDRKVTWAGSSAHRMEKGHQCISFGKEEKKTFRVPATKQTAVSGKKAASILVIILAAISLFSTLFGFVEELSGAESIPAPEPEAPIYENVPAIESRELYNDGEIIVTIDCADRYYDDYAVYMTVFNESAEDIVVCTDLLSVNGFMQQFGFYAAVQAGDAVQETLQLYTWELEQDGITDIAQIDFYLNIYREEDYADIARTELITLETDLADTYEQPPAPNGWDLYIRDDVLLRLVSFTDYSGESELQLYLENLAENTVSISVPSITVNGETVDAYLWETLRPDTRSLVSTYLYYEGAPIEEITLELLIEHLDGYEVTGFYTEIITFTP